MPWTLYRYILRELLTVMAIATTVIVSLFSFGAAIKPLSEGLLDPQALFKFIILVSPTFLAFILPFAAAFASTLVFHRLTSDNEIVACSASGMSYHLILYPVLVLGIALTLGVFYLSNWVLPRFHRNVARMVEKDVTRMLIKQVHSGQTVKWGRIRLYADSTEKYDPPAELMAQPDPPSALIQLTGLVVGEWDRDGRLKWDAAADLAHVLLYERDGQTWAIARLTDASYYNPYSEETTLRVGTFMPDPILVPTKFRNRPEFLSAPDLARLRRHPAGYEQVRNARDHLVQQIAREQLLQTLEASLSPRPSQRVELLHAFWGGRSLLTAPVVKRKDNLLLLESADDHPVSLIKHRSEGVVPLPGFDRKIEAVRGELTVTTIRLPGPGAEPKIQLAMFNAKVFDSDFEQPTTELSSVPKATLHYGRSFAEPLRSRTPAQLIQLANEDQNLLEAKTVQSARRNLVTQTARLERKIDCQLHQRSATAVCCLLTLTFGAVLSMKLRSRMPLVVYFWNFMLAAVVVFITYSGKHIASNLDYQASVGLAVVWSGTILLALVVVVAYMNLSRN